jgi:hypothetical protein
LKPDCRMKLYFLLAGFYSCLGTSKLSRYEYIFIKPDVVNKIVMVQKVLLLMQVDVFVLLLLVANYTIKVLVSMNVIKVWPDKLNI